mgnify:FL=1|tara:strand:+ start:339 stop:722 length:384 start_codon:yes stop_codon:yes gene_type:complete
MFYGIAIFIFVLVCLMLVGIILLQSSQTGGMGSAMGGQAMNTAFGGQGADKLLVKITTGLAVSYMVLAIGIGVMGNPASKIVSQDSPTISRNKGSAVLTTPVEEKLQPIESLEPSSQTPTDLKLDTE